MKKNILLIAGIILVVVVGLFALIKAGQNRCPLRGIAGNPAEARTLLEEAKRLESQQSFLESKTAYQKLVSDYPNAQNVMEWQKKIEELTMKLLFSPAITPGSIEYVVQAGDSLEKIARDHKTTVELIKRSNGLDNETIFPGKKLKVWTQGFSIAVDKSQNVLILKSKEEIIKTYAVATGKNNSTPVGTFRIIERIVNPPWYKPGGGIAPAGTPENILGTRWMGWDKEGYGIHGTTDPKSIGSQATAGCVRMVNTDVEELYSIVPQGTEVTIVD
jgi:lipoprotein-anchoring transpeptidase ErfK/SrfK